MRRHRKDSYHLLLREIRRLRSENAMLQSSVHLLKNDLAIERESRRIADIVHQKFYDETMDKHAKMEIDVLDKQDEIDALKSQLEQVQPDSSLTYHDAASIKKSSDIWHCNNFEDEVEMVCSLHSSDLNQTGVRGETLPAPLDDLALHHKQEILESDDDEDDDDEEDEDEDDTNVDRFKDLAASYLRQALISNLTSARANLELDDLMLKYDPSPSMILHTLADSFIVWINDTVSDTNSAAAAKLIVTRVREGFLQFWKAILERHIRGDEEQYQFLNEAERAIYSESKGTTSLVENFHRLLVMLYKYDIVDGDAVITWWHERLADVTNEKLGNKLRDVTRKFVEWVDEEEDDDEDDDTMSDVDDALNRKTSGGNVKDVSEDEANPPEAIAAMDEAELVKSVNTLLEESERYCLCQFDEDTHHHQDGCTCEETTPTASEPVPPQVVKKSVRIQL
ncbi:uncharacterized protein BYT42DRAFT_585097 [Radiomyces spectabilis]|uniref:uncharacterized protein n=1 Tax=Radiomyces spectabilis TaxID=64574 RepID=UPI00221F05A1|nr:uncharacterized protein BYT42DRAFT_585097 [Radiomyces spectabilis]KAI8369616.1 hypothetical protein BYT42DRAFT_585097 [Radiomyces spectabilis]